MKLSEEVIRLLPKADVHLHLDGSLRPQTVLDLARENGVSLPSQTVDGLYELVFKEQYENLTEYLNGFAYTVAVLQTAEALERAAYELMEDNILEGCRYVEVRFAPQLHVRDGLSYEQVMAAVDAGLSRARDECAAKNPRVASGEEPGYAYGIIACALRKFEPAYSTYYRRLFEIHRFAKAKEVYRMASLELARAMVDARDRLGIPVVGFDLAGDEVGYPAVDHRDAYQYAHKHFMKKTVHAGESFGPESIFQAITELYADRIGHGYHLFHPELIKGGDAEKNRHYVDKLSQFIADRRITVEVCLSSNLQTDPKLADLSTHPLGEMKKSRICYALGTDNRLISRTDTCRELALALKNFAFTRAELRNALIYGFKRSFFPGPYETKRRYVRKVIDYYESLEREHFPGDGDVLTA